MGEENSAAPSKWWYSKKRLRLSRNLSFIQSYLERILETHPWLTLSCLEMSQGRTPLCASSTILWRTMSGSGRPLTKTPPNWFTPP